MALLGGYLCCLCAFEWSHLWGFSPFLFRPGATLSLTLGFLACLGLHGLEKEHRAATALVGVCWVAVTAWPLKMSSITGTLWFASLSLGLLLCSSTGPRAVLGLALSLMLALTLLSGLWPWTVTAILVVTALAEMLRGRAWLEPSLTSGREARTRLAADASSRSLEIAWKGFAALFKATEPGEGERFTKRVLADTGTIIEGCGGRRVKGSDLSGTYRFPNQEALDRCQDQLRKYELSIQDVLAGSGAPPLQLFTERKEPVTSRAQ